MKRTHIPSVDATAASGHLPFLLNAIPSQPSPEPKRYTKFQLAGIECAECGTDLAYATGQRPHSVTTQGHRLNVCVPPCSAGTLPIVIEQAELDPGVKVVFKEFATRIRMAYDPAKVTENDAIDLLRHHLPAAVLAVVTRASK